MTAQPELLFITRNLPPLRGGMERLNAHMVAAFSQGYSVTVIAPKGSQVHSSSSLRVHCCPLPGTAWFLAWALLVSAFIAVRQRPAWVVGGSGLVGPLVLFSGLLSGARRAIYLHGLDIVVKSHVYQALWMPTLRRMHRCVVNSTNTRALAIRAGIEPEQIRVVMPGVSVPNREARVTAESVRRFREAWQLGEGPIILSVGRLTRRKGLVEFIEHGMVQVLSLCPGACLVVIGDDAPDALNSESVGGRAKIEQVARRIGVEASVHMLGPVSEEDLRTAFGAAKVHVFPGIEIVGDVEGFGMVAIEAAAHGVPTVAFDVGGIADAVENSVSGALVPPGNYELLARCVSHHLHDPDASLDESSRSFAERFAWPIFDERIRAALAPENVF